MGLFNTYEIKTRWLDRLNLKRTASELKWTLLNFEENELNFYSNNAV